MKTDRVVCFALAMLAPLLSITVAGCATGNLQIYGLGDVVDVGHDTRMVLSSSEFLDDKLEAAFTIENVGTEDHSYNLVLSLQARDTEGMLMSQLVPCGSNLDGSLQPGEQATGAICWNTEGADIVRIHYIVLFSETDIVWEVAR